MELSWFKKKNRQDGNLVRFGLCHLLVTSQGGILRVVLRLWYVLSMFHFQLCPFLCGKRRTGDVKFVTSAVARWEAAFSMPPAVASARVLCTRVMGNSNTS